MKFILKTILILFISIVILLSGLFIYFFTGQAPVVEKIDFGVTFSQYFAEQMELDWKKMYLAILDELGVKKIRLVAYWQKIEPAQDEFSFDDLDWQIKEADKRDMEIILVMGQKVPRWPECHIPDWARGLSQSEYHDELLSAITQIVNRYKGNKAIKIWQVENEPFLMGFGECPKLDKEFLDKEINLVRELDNRPILLTASGELSSWTQPARRADIFGTTLYRIVWSDFFQKHIQYPIPPVFYYKRANLVKWFTRVEKTIIIELQAEPWNHLMIWETTPEEQSKTMNLERFKEVINYTKRTGFNEAYLWGAEWWYWLREKYDDDSIWQEAQKLWID
ncbi:beta-galactosidase [Patescibacteria group bacterium]|nr:beta-galactosidase [Patescibacteria group bacterium]MBU1563633.1 beta-galactosidase [Patescibacteria group bacterium]MBU2068031.1 beta-galactosidase [Patescibacteria group bacterium]